MHEFYLTVSNNINNFVHLFFEKKLKMKLRPEKSGKNNKIKIYHINTFYRSISNKLNISMGNFKAVNNECVFERNKYTERLKNEIEVYKGQLTDLSIVVLQLSFK